MQKIKELLKELAQLAGETNPARTKYLYAKLIRLIKKEMKKDA